MRAASFLASVLVALCAASSAWAPPEASSGRFVQAVEFPYYLYPRAQWERELVWLKTLGVHTVEFSIPWNWHQIEGGEFDFNGRTSPRRDLSAFIRMLRKLDLQAWVRPLPPVAGWVNNGFPGGLKDVATAGPWLKQIGALLGPQTAKHGGPIAFVEGHDLAI
ncbi:MAG: beta-galactosidase, partial [Acidobacteriia bacterium]|nr:beta-galactosidase [Terriglobia bacterium]